VTSVYASYNALSNPGQALLENILPQHVAGSLVKLEAHKRTQAEAEAPAPLVQPSDDLDLDASSVTSQLGTLPSQWPDVPSPRSHGISSQPEAEIVVAVAPPKIAYKQWHPAVSVLFAVRAPCGLWIIACVQTLAESVFASCSVLPRSPELYLRFADIFVVRNRFRLLPPASPLAMSCLEVLNDVICYYKSGLNLI
jgi:hypothetical protein